MTPLSESAMQDAMNAIMDGQRTEQEIMDFLSALSARGETVAEITGAAKILRARAVTITAPPGAVDCCGTGGDASGTYNISTAVALVSAACGVPVAKHGNRASTSKSGAADVLEALGVNLDLSPAQLERALEKTGFAFLMAPRHHEAMKHVREARKKLGAKTIFNLLGPLANPAGIKRQLIGVYSRKWVRPIAETLNNLGAEKAWVVHGSDGLDEITVTGPTHVAILDNGAITEKTMAPADFGLPVSGAKDLLGGGAEENAQALLAVLKGAKNAYRDMVLANAAAVLCIAGAAQTLHEGVAMAAQKIDDDSALQLLEDYAAFTWGKP